MFTCFIRNLFVMLISIYTFYKLLNIQPKDAHAQFRLIGFSCFTCFFTAILFVSNQTFNWLCLLSSLFIFLKFTSKINLYTVYNTILFSFSLSFISFIFSGIISAFIFSLFLFQEYEIPWFIIRILGSIFHVLLIYYCFRIPRIKKGMKFLYHIPSGNIGSTICILLFTFILMYAQVKTYTETFILTYSSIILSIGFLLIYWWNYHITQTYRKLLRKNEIDSLNLLLEEKNQEIKYLKSENDKLSRIIHKDNKIIPALSMAILNSYKNKTALDLSSLDSDSSLHMKLMQLYNEREETLANYQQEIMHLPQTSFDSVNAILSYMQSESLKENIPFQVMLFDTMESTIPSEIAEDDFTHMLSDLLANAINACKDVSSTSIQVYLGKMDNISTIKVLNTGSVFHTDTLHNLGLVRHTTHAESGGSGIGLMDIWKIKEQYKATLLIDEAANTSLTYTCVNVLFNHKNHYIIQSTRHKELSNLINRPDIMIISKE